MTDVYFEAISRVKPGCIQKVNAKAFTKPWFVMTQTGPVFFKTREDCAKAIAVAGDVTFNDCVVFLIKNRIAIDMPQSDLDNVQLDVS